MLITNHVLSGAFIGVHTRTPTQAVALGVISHLLLDTVPHYGSAHLTQQQYAVLTEVDGFLGLAAAATILATVPRQSRARVAAGIFGACLPDTDKPLTRFFGKKQWHPQVFRKIHYSFQREHSSLATEILVAALFTAFAVTAVQTERNRYG